MVFEGWSDDSGTLFVYKTENKAKQLRTCRPLRLMARRRKRALTHDEDDDVDENVVDGDDDVEPANPSLLGLVCVHVGNYLHAVCGPIPLCLFALCTETKPDRTGPDSEVQRERRELAGRPSGQTQQCTHASLVSLL